jgi:choice-of-anchor B domain-containing protein
MRQNLTYFMLCAATLLVSSAVSAQNPVSNKTTLQSHWIPADLPAQQWNYIHFNSCWGYAAPDGREYAILGGTDRIYFIDITNPANPVEVAVFPGNAPTVWREFKSFGNRIYAVADGSAEGMQIFDMTGAPNNIKRTYFSNAIFGSAHTITMDETKGIIFANSAGSCIEVLDAKANPDAPVHLGTLKFPGCEPHDTYFENGKLFVSNGNSGLFILDVAADLLNPPVLASTSTNGYNHSGCTDKSGRYFYYLEEIPEARPGRVIDLVALPQGEINEVGQFFEPLLAPTAMNAIYHNPFRKGDLLFVAAYQDGMVVFDISDPIKPKRVAWYDTYANTTYTGYTGTWSVYPWLPSGNVIVGDMVSGLYVVKVDASLTGTQTIETGRPDEAALVCYPNPVGDQLSLTTHSFTHQIDNQQFSIADMTGKVAMQGRMQGNTLSVSTLAKGMYIATLRTDNGFVFHSKFVKQ